MNYNCDFKGLAFCVRKRSDGKISDKEYYNNVSIHKLIGGRVRFFRLKDFIKAFATFLLNAPCFTKEQLNEPIPHEVKYFVFGAVCEMLFGNDPVFKAAMVDGNVKHMADRYYNRLGDEVSCLHRPAGTVSEIIKIVENGLSEYAPKTRGDLVEGLDTVIIRKNVHADFWLELMRREIIRCNNRKIHWIVTHVQSQNEIEIIKENDGLCVYVSNTVEHAGKCDPDCSACPLDGTKMPTLVNDQTVENSKSIASLLSNKWSIMCYHLAQLPKRKIGFLQRHKRQQ